MQPTLFIWGDACQYPNYQQAVEAAGGQVRFSRDLSAGEGCQGLLLPGGGDLAPGRYGEENRGSGPADLGRDEAELTLAARFAAMHKPILGICRGMQVLNVCFGGTLVQDLPGHSACGNVDGVHGVTTSPSFLATLYGNQSTVNSSHHQAVSRLGEGLRAVQWAEDGVVEALCHETLPVWGMQWHPERLCGAFARSDTVDGGAVFRWFCGSL